MAAEGAAEVPEAVAQMGLSRLMDVGQLAHAHNQQFNKILDLSYEMDRKMVSVVQALGIREITSKAGQKGVPGSAD